MSIVRSELGRSPDAFRRTSDSAPDTARFRPVGRVAVAAVLAPVDRPGRASRWVAARACAVPLVTISGARE